MGKITIAIILFPLFIFCHNNPNSSNIDDISDYFISNGICSYNSTGIKVGYTSFYSMKEIQKFNLSYLNCLRDYSYGVDLSFFGGSLYNEELINVLYVKTYNIISVGLRIKGGTRNIKNIDREFLYNCDVFANTNRVNRFNVGIYTNNLVNMFNGNCFTMGTNILFDYKNTILSSNLIWKSTEQLNINLMVTNRLNDIFKLRIGISIFPQNFFCGFAIEVNKYIIANNITYIPELGFTENVNIIYRFNYGVRHLKRDRVVRYNINTITFKELLNLGIVSDIACGIIDYRLSDGDIMDINELLKVKGIGKAWIGRNKDMFYISIKRYDINKASKNLLLKIPGIPSYLRKRIVKYRATHHIDYIDELSNIEGINDEYIRILKRFLKCEV